jgi:hypothetical protein
MYKITYSICTGATIQHVKFVFDMEELKKTVNALQASLYSVNKIEKYEPATVTE